MSTKTKEEVMKTVVGIFSENLEVPIERIKPEASIVDDLGAGSLKIYEILGESEVMFEIEITDNEIGKIKTVDDLVKCIVDKK